MVNSSGSEWEMGVATCRFYTGGQFVNVSVVFETYLSLKGKLNIKIFNSCRHMFLFTRKPSRFSSCHHAMLVPYRGRFLEFGRTRPQWLQWMIKPRMIRITFHEFQWLWWWTKRIKVVKKVTFFLGRKWFDPKLFGGKFSLKKMILFVNLMDPRDNSL